MLAQAARLRGEQPDSAPSAAAPHYAKAVNAP
jgi:hypothetical protein